MDQRPQLTVPTVVAFLDIGTNSIRLLLTRVNPNGSYTVMSRQKEVVKLGEGEFIDQALHPEAMQRAATICRQFAELARSRQAQEIIAVATSATRGIEAGATEPPTRSSWPATGCRRSSHPSRCSRRN